MSPEHARLAALLQDAAQKRGGQAALARDLDLDPKEVSNLIRAKRFVTKVQAVKIENLLGISARELWLEAAAAEFDEWRAKVTGR